MKKLYYIIITIIVIASAVGAYAFYTPRELRYWNCVKGGYEYIVCECIRMGETDCGGW